MAVSRAKVAAVGALGAMLLALSPARAGEPKPGKSRAAATRRDGRAHASEGGTRHGIAGAPTAEDATAGVESAELTALREAEQELFPPAAPAQGSPWPSDLPFAMPGEPGPRVAATGVPPAVPGVPVRPDTTRDLAWLTRLDLPDLPVRWDDRVVRYLEFFRDDPRGRATFASLFKRSGRFRDMMRRTLRGKSLPEDLVWVAMIESGFEPVARSSAGAAGLWQFLPDTGRIYGLSIDRWVDQRLAPQAETAAAADFLGDLHRRFGSWDLALAAYNMGYGGVAAIVRRYNTNDFWSLARTEGTLPWQTTLYVPKILAAAVVAHNLAAFGFAELAIDPPVEYDEVNVSPGTPLSLVAQAAGCTPRDLDGLNPELRALRTPPAGEGDVAYPVKVPRGKGDAAAQALSRMRAGQPALDRYVVRFGETLDQIAAAHKTTAGKLVELNAIAPGEAVRGGTVLLVPRADAPAATAAVSGAAAPKPTVVVPAEEFVYPDRKRVFYRVQVGDTLPEIAGALHVPVDDLDRWNDIDPAARLQEGMTLQAFVPQGADLSRVLVASETDVRVLPLGSEEFFASQEHDRGFRRVVVPARKGDTLESIGRRFDVPARTMERVNRRDRSAPLADGESIVVYAPAAPGAPAPPAPPPPLPAPETPAAVPANVAPSPVPDLLP